MSEHKVEVVRVIIEPHTNADALELARVGDYLSIVRKDQYKSGDLVAYIPEQSLVPKTLLEEMGLTDKLAGSEKNRVKAIRLRGVLSQGICYTARPSWVEGQNVAEELGITKWVPPVPAHLAGEVWPAGQNRCLKYDIENIKKWTDVIQPGEQVIFSEKVHGTFCQIGVLPSALSDSDHGDVIIASKGLGGQGLAFKLNEANARNLYVRATRTHDVVEAIRRVGQEYLDKGYPVYVLGEVFGRNVQDLDYGASSATDEEIGFRVFDIFIGAPGMGYTSDAELDQMVFEMGLKRVPVLYRGPFSKEVLEKWTNGKETISGKSLHVREGVVVRPVKERRASEIGRVQLKSVSADYLLRKGDVTEFN